VDRAQAIAQLTSEGLRVTEWRDDPNTSYPEHAHPQREARIVLEGRMTVRAGGREHELGPGDRFDIAANERHTATVGSDGVHYIAGS
jgi:quercetin dioxygenase-like cupin family protein